jgi:hypothetical protein
MSIEVQGLGADLLQIALFMCIGVCGHWSLWALSLWDWREVEMHGVGICECLNVWCLNYEHWGSGCWS